MNIFKSTTLKWWQVGIFKLTAFSAALLIATYWPAILGLTTLWWIVFVVCAVWGLKIYFGSR